VVIGNCNGAQVLVESGLIPLDRGLAMSLARNAVDGEAVGFLNEWVWITRTCARDRCATSDWEGVMHLPIAHGEGRFVTKDTDLIEELKKNDQLAFSYCDASRRVSDKPPLCPNGSLLGIAGICNPAGNVVALMPHPERTQEGLRYFLSIRKWIERRKKLLPPVPRTLSEEYPVAVAPKRSCEIFIDTIITNNEERTVEQAARRIASTISLKQLKYFAPGKDAVDSVLTHLSLFNPNKEIAYIRREGKLLRWNPDVKREESYTGNLLEGSVLLRIDEPDTGARQLGEGSVTGVCYVCSNIDEQKLYTREVLEVFANPHASQLLKMP